MPAIWKFPVVVTDAFAVHMPHGAEVLSVQMQGEEPMMWALVNTTAPLVERLFAVHGTGHEVPVDRTRHVGTFQMHGGALVFHLFEVTPRG